MRGLVASAASPLYNAPMPTLNERAHELCNAMAADADKLGIAVSTLACGTRIIDCGVKRWQRRSWPPARRYLPLGLGRRLHLGADPGPAGVARGYGRDQGAGGGLHGIAIRRLGNQRREVFRDGLRPDARGCLPRRDIQRYRQLRASQPSASACSKRGSCRPTPSASTSPKSAASRPIS